MSTSKSSSGTFKTYGSATESLSHYLKEHVDSSRYGHPDFFAVKNLSVHRSFCEWCTIHGIPDMASLREVIRERIQRGEMESSDLLLRGLCDTLPRQFNVRGEWTPEEPETDDLPSLSAGEMS